MDVTTKSQRETQDLGRQIATKLTGGEILALVGDLGAGKTTFTQGLVTGLGSQDRVTSPTFILMREYAADGAAIKNIYHIDLYRLEGEGQAVWEQVQALGVEDLWKNKDNLVIIEWAERVADFLPEETVWIQFTDLGEDTRKIKID